MTPPTRIETGPRIGTADHRTEPVNDLAIATLTLVQGLRDRIIF